MLVRMAHRGGCGCEPSSGDGAGILTGMPDAFLRRALAEELGLKLPPLGEYGLGNVFLPRDAAAAAECKRLVEAEIAASKEIELVGWRPTPVDNAELGPTPLASEPLTEMLIVAPTAPLPPRDLNRELWRLRILAAKRVHAASADFVDDFYFNSLCTHVLIYKGQLHSEQARRPRFLCASIVAHGPRP